MDLTKIHAGFSMDISSIYIALCGLLLVTLSARVVRGRWRYHVGIGDGGVNEFNRLIRVQANATEYLPMALLLLVALENSIADNWPVHLLGSLLVVSRLLHAFGLGKTAGTSMPRMLGTAGTWLAILVPSVVLLVNSLR